MILPSLIPLPWKIGAGVLLVAALLAGHLSRVHSAYQQGRAAAVAERAASDSAAIIQRSLENAALGVKHATINTVITKAKNEELAPVVQRIAAERVRVGAAICGSAAATKTEDAPSSDGDHPPGRLVREDVERDLRALKLAVEQDLATGRACQAWGRENGFIP